jgi:hypothetical protein
MMRATGFAALAALLASCGAMAAGRAADESCVEDAQAVEGWYVTESRRAGSSSYLILQKKQQGGQRFFLCRLAGEVRHFVGELGIELDTAVSHLAAARCTPVESGVPGDEYFAVLDNGTARMLKVYRFDAVAEDVELLAADSVVCSALPVGASPR